MGGYSSDVNDISWRVICNPPPTIRLRPLAPISAAKTMVSAAYLSLHSQHSSSNEFGPPYSLLVLSCLAQVQNLELLDSRAEQAQRSDRSDANLWESERLQKSDAAALRQQGGVSAPASGAGVAGGGAYQPSPEELEAKARKKAAEDAWWSAEPEGPSTATGAGAGDSTTAGRNRESSWWEEEDVTGRGGGTGSKGIDADELPSFFDS